MKKFDNFARLTDDDCALVTKELQNNSINDYLLYNTYVTSQCKQDRTTFDEFVANNPNLRFKDGSGFLNGCTVDNDSQLRNGAKITHDKEKIQLQTRWNQAVPSFNKGGLIVNVDTRLKSSEDTSVFRSCDKVVEKNFDRFIPLPQCLARSIQNPQHIIPTWTWGGDATRQYVQDSTYLAKCGFKNEGNMWKRVD
jgi:hypothetical protein